METRKQNYVNFQPETIPVPETPTTPHTPEKEPDTLPSPLITPSHDPAIEPAKN